MHELAVFSPTSCSPFLAPGRSLYLHRHCPMFPCLHAGLIHAVAGTLVRLSTPRFTGTYPFFRTPRYVPTCRYVPTYPFLRTGVGTYLRARFLRAGPYVRQATCTFSCPVCTYVHDFTCTFSCPVRTYVHDFTYRPVR